MVGSNQVHLNDYTRAFGRCEVKAFRNGTMVTVLPLKALRCVAGFGGEPNQEKTEPPEERSFTELRFASFPLQFCGTERAIKGRDERPSGALDGPLRLCRDGDLFFLLTPPTLS